MKRRLIKKIKSLSGETIAETLLALLISALALVMLAGAIGTAARVVTRSENKMQEYYQGNNQLAKLEDGKETTVTINTALIKEKDFSVKYTSNTAFSKPVVAYAK